MGAFAAAAQAVFADPNMAADALYLERGLWPGQPVRVIRSEPSRVGAALDHDFVLDAIILDVLVSAVPALARQDAFLIGEDQFDVISDPVRDAQGLVWRASVRRA